MNSLRLLPLLLAVVIALGSCGRCAAPEKRKVKRIDTMLDDYVKSERIAGAAAIVLRDGMAVYQKLAGWADRENAKPMRMDTLFRIASMTKALTSLGILLLIEEKKIGRYDRLARYIPEFAHLEVVVKDAQTKELKKEPAKRAMTIHQLLTHTSGLTYGTHPDIAEEFQKEGLGRALGAGWNLSTRSDSICKIARKIGKLPLAFQPGGPWVYGYSTDVLGCVIEIVSKKSLDKFFEERITGPLGMKDTFFYVPKTEADRLAVLYGSTKDGKSERYNSLVRYPYIDGPRRTFSGGAGLISTALDYAKFLEMIRQGGRLGDVRIASPETVKLMSTAQVATSYTHNLGFGYGFEVSEKPGYMGKEGAGSFGWTGAYGTFYRIDPINHLVIVLMTQLYPNNTDIKPQFWDAVYNALDELQVPEP
ncbi:MAG: beta-lactamase family protein [Spirochaetes bacterium]|nr:beta-lactamase family protein [Spirochaetota bacterium]